MGRACVVVLGVLSVLPATGCGSRCKDVASVRSTLTSRVGVPARAADVQLTIPLVRANALIEELLTQQPLSASLDVPDLGPLQLVVRPLTATVREVKLQPGSPGRVRFAVRLDLSDPEHEVTTIAAIAELEPVLTRGDGAAVLSIGLGPENVLELKPELGPDAVGSLGSAVTRWMPAKLKDRLPQPLVDAAARKLGGHLTGAAWAVLQRTLFVRLGELTKLRLRLPDVPIARIDLRTTSAPEILVIDVVTDLPVRAGLAPGASAGTEIAVRIAGSAAAELANWAIDQGHAPQRYDRSLKPSPDGEFRPRFDYLAGASHPLKVYAFQEHGGCSYFRVGVAARLAMVGTQLEVTATDRDLEAMDAHRLIEVAAWVKYVVTGAIDRSKRVAAHTQLSVGSYALVTEVISAALTGDEVAFGLRFTAPPAVTARVSR